MKILITGSKGQLGKVLQGVIKKACCETSEGTSVSETIKTAKVLAVDIDRLNILNELATKEFIINEKPDVVINCAGYSKVDKCENLKNMAFAINANGPKILATACNLIGAKLVQVSTDYIFSDGVKDDLVCGKKIEPKTVYGKTKLAGEEFVKTISKKHFIVRRPFLDESGLISLAEYILKIIETENYGIHHCNEKGECNLCE